MATCPATTQRKSYDAAMLLDSAVRQVAGGKIADKAALRAALGKSRLSSRCGAPFVSASTIIRLRIFICAKVVKRPDGKYADGNGTQSAIGRETDSYAAECHMPS